MDAADVAKLAALRTAVERAEQDKRDAEAGIEKLLQKLPQDETLLFFYGEGCTFTNRYES